MIKNKTTVVQESTEETDHRRFLGPLKLMACSGSPFPRIPIPNSSGPLICRHFSNRLPSTGHNRPERAIAGGVSMEEGKTRARNHRGRNAGMEAAYVRVRRADENVIASGGDEGLYESAEPWRVNPVVVRHHQLRPRTRRQSSFHSSGPRSITA
ncbi:hypothetical protein ACLOJK_028770 [Asimina triloba]